MRVIEAVVPCNRCTECCKGDAIFMHPECGDDPSQYETEDYDGRLVLKHKENGDCIYLGEHGCTIHSRRPVVCRELDCRMFITRLTRDARRDLVRRGIVKKSVIRAALRILNN